MPVPAPGASAGALTPTAAAAPTPNLGAEAHAAQQVKQALIMLETALPNVPLGSPLHGAVRTSINSLAKHIGGTGGQDAGLNASMVRDLALKQQQQSPLLAALQAARAKQAGTPGGAAGASGAVAPPPETPEGE